MSDEPVFNTKADQRRTTEEKVARLLAVLDLLRIVVGALFSMFGRRKGDR